MNSAPRQGCDTPPVAATYQQLPLAGPAARLSACPAPSQHAVAAAVAALSQTVPSAPVLLVMRSVPAGCCLQVWTRGAGPVSPGTAGCQACAAVPVATSKVRNTENFLCIKTI